MAKNQEIFLTKEGKTVSISISATGGYTDVFTAGAEGSKLLAIGLVAAGAATIIDMAINDPGGAAIDERIGRIGTPVDGQDMLDAMTYLPEDRNGNRYINLPPLAKLRIDPQGSGTITVMAYHEEY